MVVSSPPKASNDNNVTTGNKVNKLSSKKMRNMFDKIVGREASDENGRRVLDVMNLVLNRKGYGHNDKFLEQTVRLVWCESRLDPRAYNSTPVWNGEHASGLFQFLPSTFASVGGGDIWKIEDQTEAYILMVESGRINEWACHL